MTPQEIAIAALEEASHEDDPVDIAVTYKIALEQIAKGGWIPVSERLPEDGTQAVIVSKKKIISTALWNGKAFCLYEQDYMGNYIDLTKKDVIAWMPLPEAYKEAADETD